MADNRFPVARFRLGFEARPVRFRELVTQAMDG